MLAMSTAGRRHRVSVACVPCRKKKCRCDGQKPVCAVCEKEGKLCEYTHHLEKRKPPTKCYIHALHSRIWHLELQLAQCRDNPKASASSLLDYTPVNPVAAEDPASFRPNSLFPGAYGHLGTFEGLCDTQENRAQGESLTDNVLHLRESPFLLDPGLQAHLLTEFWTWQNNWPIVVHQPLFLEDLSGNGAIGYSTPAVLSALFALAAQHTDVTQIHHHFPTFNKKASIDSLVQRAKALVLDQIEHPTLSLVVASCLISLREMSMDNLAAASQYIGIAVRHILVLGPCTGNVEKASMATFSTEIGQARSIAWLGVWMVEKHLAQAMGQPSTIRETDLWPTSLPTLPSVEYSLWPPADDILTPQIISSCMSNFQYACDLLRMVSPVLDEIYAQPSLLSFEDKEDKATKVYVAVSEFYNNLPSSLRLPPSITTLLPPHVYQFNLQYHNLKIMLHRPFIRSTPSVEALQDSQSPKALHLQSATFSAIRISYIVKSFERFYQLNRLSPFTVTTLAMSSLIHLFNANSKDPTLALRSKNLYEMNMHVLNHMNATTKSCGRKIRTLQSIARNQGILTSFDYDEVFAHGHRVENDQRIDSKATHQGQTAESHPRQLQMPPLSELSATEMANPSPVDSFDWFELPLNDILMNDGDFFDAFCSQDEWQYFCLEDVDSTASFV